MAQKQITNKRHSQRLYSKVPTNANRPSAVRIRLRNVTKAVNLDANRQQAFMRLLPIQSDDTIYEFHFPFSPVDIQYDGLANEIAEIDRPGATPMLAFKKHNLLKVSFDFIIAVPFDGVKTSIDSDLALLRQMAVSVNRPVQIFNLDGSFEKVIRRRYQPTNTKHKSYVMKFRIADLSFNSVKRNQSGSITQASCKITLIEDVNPRIDTALIPKFVPPPLPPKKTTTTKTPTVKDLPKATDATDANANDTPAWAKRSQTISPWERKRLGL